MDLSFEDFETMVTLKDFFFKVTDWDFLYYNGEIDRAFAKVHDLFGNYPDIWFDVYLINDSIDISFNERIFSQKSNIDRRLSAYQQILLANPFMLEQAENLIEDYAFKHGKIKAIVNAAEGICDPYVDWIWNDEKEEKE